jgi:hypothetical protein
MTEVENSKQFNLEKQTLKFGKELNDFEFGI